MDRQSCDLDARADVARPAETREVERQPVGDVHHRGDAVRRQDRRLSHPRHRSHRSTEGVAFVLRPGSLRRHAEPRRRATERTRHDDAIAGLRTATAHGPPRSHLPGHAHHDRELPAARQVPPDQRERELVATLPHPSGQLDDPRRIDRVGEGERAEREPRASPHRRDVADVDRDRLVAEVARRGPVDQEVHPLDHRVGGQHQLAGTGPDHGSVVAGPHEDLGTGAREDPPDRGDQFVFGEIHLRRPWSVGTRPVAHRGRNDLGRRPLGRSLDSRLSASPRVARIHRPR